MARLLTVYSRHDQLLENTALMRMRGLAHQAAGETHLAAVDYSQGLQQFESRRQSIADEGERIAFFAQARELAEDLLVLEVDREHDSRTGLRIADWAKARALEDSRYDPAGEPAQLERAPSVAALQRQLPPGTCLVEYAALRDRVFVWALDSRTASFAQIPIAAADLARLVRRFRDALRVSPSGDEAQDLAAALYDLLLRPVATVAEHPSNVVFVPDQSLNGLPFAALYDRSAHQLLAERQVCSVAPSAHLYLAALARSRAPAKTTADSAVAQPILIVINNLIDRGALPDLPPLPAADREAARLAALYPRATVLAGADATPRHLREILASRSFQIIHFATHSVAIPGAPFSSALVLAADPPRDSGLMDARQLARLRLPATRLIVLSSCSTATGTTAPLEGVLNLARPLIAAGVPAVLATLWDIADQSSEQLITDFYIQLWRGLPPAAALRSAQLHFLHTARGTASGSADWAAFTIYGA